MLMNCASAFAGKDEGSEFDEGRMKALANETMSLFAAGAASNNFSAFRANASEIFQKKFSAATILNAFKQVIDEKAVPSDIVKKHKPVFTSKPELSDGQLILRGYYPSNPKRLLFSFYYADEKKSWKIVSINLNAVEAPLSLPSDKELAKLADKSLNEFINAVQAGDFSSLRANASKPFNKQIKEENLLAAFAGFIRKEKPLARDVKESVSLFEPDLNSNGVLTLKGNCALQKSRLSFTFKYIFENWVWKLLSLDFKEYSQSL